MQDFRLLMDTRAPGKTPSRQRSPRGTPSSSQARAPSPVSSPVNPPGEVEASTGCHARLDGSPLQALALGVCSVSLAAGGLCCSQLGATMWVAKAALVKLCALLLPLPYRRAASFMAFDAVCSLVGVLLAPNMLGFTHWALPVAAELFFTLACVAARHGLDTQERAAQEHVACLEQDRERLRQELRQSCAAGRSYDTSVKIIRYVFHAMRTPLTDVILGTECTRGRRDAAPLGAMCLTHPHLSRALLRTQPC